MLLQLVSEFLYLGDSAAELGDLSLRAPEQLEVRKNFDAQSAAHGLVAIVVDRDEPYVGTLSQDAVQLWVQRPAGATPACKEVDHNQRITCSRELVQQGSG